MLQQTQVERVEPKYRDFLARFPTLHALAEAPVADVIKAWTTLGYNMRAVRLREIARQAVADYGGKLPDTLDGLLALKGIGRYTAGAIACFAYEQPVATVDTNIRRVLWRVFRGVEPATWPTGERATRDALGLAEWALPPARAYDWQQALMDLGATVCLSRRPLCERCPLSAHCAAYAETATHTLFPSGEALARLRSERAAASTNAQPPLAAIAERRAAYTSDAIPTDAPADAATPTPRRRASAAKAAQPFTSTSRYYRGRIVAALSALPNGASLTLAELGPQLKPDFTARNLPWLHTLASGLVRDGLARFIAAPTTAADGEQRIALP